MENVTNRLNKIALWLLAIVPGIYLLNVIGTSFFHLSPVLFYTILIIAAIVYLVIIVIMHKAYLHMKEHNLALHKEKIIHRLDA